MNMMIRQEELFEKEKITVDEKLVDKIFNQLQNEEFPYYELTMEEKIKHFEKLRKFKSEHLLKEKIICQSMHGLNLAWSYFPHHWEVPVKSQKTPMEIWKDKSLLKKAIKKRLERGGLTMLLPNQVMTKPQIRKTIRNYSGVQSISNFRPSAASCIYKYFAGNGVVWDMSCGFGGRLLGAYASGKVKKYFGCDPSTKTFEGLINITKDFEFLEMETQIYKIGSEHFLPSEEVDLCFTSPPYFNLEQYSEDEQQSFKLYKTQQSWNESFLRKTIRNCYECLKVNGFLLLNIANVKSHKNLEKDTIEICVQEKFILKDIYYLALSNTVKGGFKYEPIFIFKKN